MGLDLLESRAGVVQVGVGFGDSVRVAPHGIFGAGELAFQLLHFLPRCRVLALQAFQLCLHFGIGIGTLQPSLLGFPEVGSQLVHLLAEIRVSLSGGVQLRGELLMCLHAGLQLAFRRFECTLILLDGLLLQLELLLKARELRLCPGSSVFEVGDAGRRQLELGVGFLKLLVDGAQVCTEVVAVQ